MARETALQKERDHNYLIKLQNKEYMTCDIS